MNSSVASLFDALASQLQVQLSQKSDEIVTVFPGEEGGELSAESLCWTWTLSIDSTSRIMAAAPIEAWRDLCNLHGDVSTEDLQDDLRPQLTPAVEETIKSRFGSEVVCMEETNIEIPPTGWTSVPFAIHWESGREVTIQVSINPDLEAALGSDEESELPSEVLAEGGGSNSVEILMDVEMSVSVSLGRAKLRLKDLLQVSSGSVVELDQELSDEVEIRVNNHLIAYGEVVAVEGNYAVRILRMAQPRNSSLPGILSERAA